jgi:Subtilase family
VNAIRTRIGTVSFGVVLAFHGYHAFGQCTGHVELSESDRRGLVASVYGRDAVVAAELLTVEGCTERVLASLGELGVKVRYSDAKLGYAFVTVPREKVLDVLDIPGIAYARVPRIYEGEGLTAMPDRRVSALPTIEIPFPNVAKELPKDGPYFGAGEAGLTELWKEHPEADGRGVRVAVADEGIDLFHPALKKALDASGHSVPKVADIVAVTMPDENPNWVEFGDAIAVTHGTFIAADHTWTVPSNGSYRFGIYERTLVLGPAQNSHTKKLPLGVGVLWSEQQGRVWVNTHGDGDFSKETPLKDYSVSQDVAFFGTQSAEGDNRIPFGVKIDDERHAVYIAIENGGHGIEASGPLAANRLTGGLYDGAAPNAQLVDVVADITKMLPVVKAFARPDVDVINRSGGIGRYTDDDREGFERHVLERAVAVYDKPIVSFSAGKNLLLINDYVSGEMLRRNRQIGPPYSDAMNSFVWFDPDGVVNTVLGPSGNLIALSRYMPLELQWDDGRRHTYDDGDFDPPAPAGYKIGSNNSPTIPIVSGVLADLISEARHEHVRYSAARLYQALTTSARLVPGFPISEQGYGVVNAAAAWDRLAEMASADDPSNPELTSFTIQRKEGGETREVNGFSMKLSTVGATIDGELRITRHGGYTGGRPYRLALRGNVGSFSLVDTKTIFVRDHATRVRFKATVGSKWHVAFLQLIDAKTDAVMEEVPLSVEGPDVPEIVSTGVEKYTATKVPRHEEYGFVQLGDEVQAARFAMSIPFEGPEGISGRHLPPRLRNPHDEKAPAGEPIDAAHHVGPLESLETLFANTKPGIQQFYWENRGSHAEYETPYDEPPAATVPITGTVTVTKYAVTISKKDDLTLQVTNELADIDGQLELYDAKVVSSEQKGDGAHASVDVQRELPAHLSQWRVDVAASSLPTDAADVFLLNCTDAKNGCYVAAQKAISKNSAPLVIEDPKEGTWRMVIRTREPIGEPVEYRVQEAMLTPAATPLEASDSKHASGATWSVALPPKQGDVEYVAFHIAGNPNKTITQNGDDKTGLDIALTPLDRDAP